jgi:ABC-type Fe3+-hydroxamate transport system substrate-binding protein
MSDPPTPRRIVSLVPSLTEALIAFGCADRMVGRTRYCVEPSAVVDTIEAVGGTKNPDVDRILALVPDLVVLNKEENRREDAEALIREGIPVLVTHPRSVEEAAVMLEDLGRAVGAVDQAARLVHACRCALDKAREHARGHAPIRVFCPIWRNPWMTFRMSTYIGSMLEAVGFENVFGDEGASDFFTIELDDALAREPRLILLPDEPYAFGRKHGEELRTRGAKAEILYVDGRDLSWYGPRVPSALERLSIISRDISRI